MPKIKAKNVLHRVWVLFWQVEGVTFVTGQSAFNV